MSWCVCRSSQAELSTQFIRNMDEGGKADCRTAGCRLPHDSCDRSSTESQSYAARIQCQCVLAAERRDEFGVPPAVRLKFCNWIDWDGCCRTPAYRCYRPAAWCANIMPYYHASKRLVSFSRSSSVAHWQNLQSPHWYCVCSILLQLQVIWCIFINFAAGWQLCIFTFNMYAHKMPEMSVGTYTRYERWKFFFFYPPARRLCRTRWRNDMRNGLSRRFL